MRKRNIADSDVRNALYHAASAEPGREGCWELAGPDMSGDELVVIVAIKNGVIVVTAYEGGF